MVKTSVMPKETAAELLLYLADNESFRSASRDLAGGVTAEEIRALLREIARELIREASEEGGAASDAKGSARLTPRARAIVSRLSDREERRLLSAFGLAGR